MTVEERVSAALAARYRLARELGAGGMAMVYLAHDLKHDCDVAVKVLRPELGAVLGAERFLAEIWVTARLQHPHILPLLDSGEAVGLLYYVMPYVTGETLRARLERERQLGVDEVLRIVRALAGALDYAHAQGVIHRDLKPENILFQANEPVLADFGIALAVKSAGGERLTQTGLSLGTPHYMSPEQAAGERGVDARSDVYALGSVVYELLAGEPPHTGPTTAAILAKVLTQAPVPLGVVRPGVPAHMEVAVTKALAKAPADRYASAGEFAAAIGTRTEGADLTRRRQNTKSVVVLPFVNAGGSADDDFFSDGLTEELITDLSRLEGVRVVSSAVSFRLKGSDKPVPAIAAELDARFAVMGRIRRSGDSVRITAQLVEAADERPLWAERFTGTMDELFEFQERVSGAIAGALRVQVGTRRRIVDPVVSDLLRRARHYMREMGDDFDRRALACCDEALALDPGCADALALEARILASIATGAFSRDVDDQMQQARAAAQHAVEIAPELADAHLALALVNTYEWDFSAAERCFQEALRLDPRLTAARYHYGLSMACLEGRWDEAKEQLRLALETDPLDPGNHLLRVWIAMLSGAVPDAVAAARRSVEIFPKWGMASYSLGHALRMAGAFADAAAAYQRALDLDGPAPMVTAYFGAACALAGRRDDALRCLTELEALDDKGEPVDVWLYFLYGALGDDRRAIEQLDRAVARRAPPLVWVPFHPWQERYRSHPSFYAMLRAMGLSHMAQFLVGATEAASVQADADRGNPPIPHRPYPLVGRAAERADLLARLDHLEQGVGGNVLLGGEPGVGKTRLAESVLEAAFARGWLCVVGHCYEMEGTPAYTPVIEQLEHVARALPVSELRAALGDAAPEIARFFPGLRRLLPDVGPPMELPPEQQRPYLHARFREYVERLAARGPVVVLVDDLHWADESSLLLLEALAPRLATLPVLVVGTYRDVELEIGRPFAAVLERLTRQRHAERLAVRRLPEPDVAALLAALGGSTPPESLVQAIQHETEGNPFFVEEVFAHLQEEGRLFDAAGGWRTDLSLAELGVPEGVKLVIGRRLARVAEATRAALTVAAVIGPRFAPALVEQVAGVSGDAVLDALDEAERAGLVRPLGGRREARYGFGHELIRHTLVSGLAVPRRQRLHLRIADALERVYAGKLEEHAADLAYHLYEAGAAVEPARAIGALLRAAEQTVNAGAYRDALAHVERAESLDLADVAQRATALRIRSGAARGLARWDDAVRDGEDAIRLYQKMESHEHDLLYAHLVEMLVYHGRLPHALALARQRQGDYESSPTGAILAAWAGFAEGTVGDESVAEKSFTEAARIARETGDDYAVAAVIFVRSMYLAHRGRVRESIPGYHAAIDRLLALGKDWYAAPALSHVMWGLISVGNVAEATQLLPKASAVAERVGHAGAREHISALYPVMEWSRTGDCVAVERGIAADAPRMRLASPGLANYCELFAALLRFYQGNWQEPLARVALLGYEHGIETWNHLYPAWAFALKAYRAEPEGMELLETFRHRLPCPGGERVWGTWMVLKPVIEGLVVYGRRAEAAALYDAASEMHELGYVLEFSGAFETSTALAATCAAQWDHAERHFENALNTVDTTPHILGQGETRRWYAWMCLERGAAGDAAKALALLDGARRIYERIGMPKHIEMVHALRARAEQLG